MKTRRLLLFSGILLLGLLVVSCAVRPPRHRPGPPPSHQPHRPPHGNKPPKPPKKHRPKYRRDVPSPPPERPYLLLHGADTLPPPPGE